MLGGCGLFLETPGPEGSDALISVLVTGEVPDEEIILEIGRSAWTVSAGTPGSAGLSAPDPQAVRLLRIGDCEELTAFDADPGTAHAIVFAADASVSVEDRTEEQDAGVPLERRDPGDCG